MTRPGRPYNDTERNKCHTLLTTRLNKGTGCKGRRDPYLLIFTVDQGHFEAVLGWVDGQHTSLTVPINAEHIHALDTCYVNRYVQCANDAVVTAMQKENTIYGTGSSLRFTVQTPDITVSNPVISPKLRVARFSSVLQSHKHMLFTLKKRRYPDLPYGSSKTSISSHKTFIPACTIRADPR